MENCCVFCGNYGIYREYLDDVICEQCLKFILEYGIDDANTSTDMRKILRLIK